MTAVAIAGMPGAGRRTLVRALGDLGDFGDDGIRVGLFLIDPAAVADDDDARLLRELRGDNAGIALVCTKIDAYWDWPDMLSRSCQVLDPDRRLPVFAVSAIAALAGDGGSCGTADLVDWIGEQSMAGDELRQMLLEDLEIQSEIDELRIEVAADESAQVAVRREAVAAGRDRGRADRLHAVRAESGRLRNQMLVEVRSDTQSLAESVTAEAGRSRSGAVDFERWLRTRFEAQATRTARRLSDELAALKAATMVGLGDGASAEAGVAARELQPPQLRPVPEPAARREDLMVVLLGASAGLGLGRLVVAPMAAVDTLKWISMPLSLALGFIVAAVVVRERRRAAARGRLRGWAMDAVAEFRLGLEQEVVGAVAAAETTLSGRIGRHYERSARVVADELARIDRDAAQSRRRRAEAEGRLAELVTRRSRGRDGTGAAANASKQHVR